MSRPLSFPGLGIELDINSVALAFGPFKIYWYGIIVVSGMMAALYYCSRRARSFGIHPDRMSDIVMYSIVGGLIGARAYYVLFSWEFYSQHPDKIFAIWEGGIAIYGGILGGILCIFLLTKFWKMKLLPVLDLAAGGLILGQAIGRWGNFMNIEAFGSNTTLPWGMTGPSIVAYLEAQAPILLQSGIVVDPTVPVHPTFFYESIWNLIGFAFLVWYTSRRRYHGELALLYLAWYGAGRSWIEGLRTDSLMMGNFRASQLLAIGFAIAAASALVYFGKRYAAKTLPNAMELEPLEQRLTQADEMMVKKAVKTSQTEGETAEKPLDKDN